MVNRVMRESKSDTVAASLRALGGAPAGSAAPAGAGVPGPEDEAYPIRIARDGTWFYQGSPIGRQALVRLFASVLRRDDAGDYWLITPAERGRVTVDDAPFVAVELEVEGAPGRDATGGDVAGADQRLRLRTNLDEWVDLGPDHPLRVDTDPASGEPRPYVRVRPGLEARVNRPVFYHLVALAVPDATDPDRLGVWSRGVFFPLGSLDGGAAAAAATGTEGGRA